MGVTRRLKDVWQLKTGRVIAAIPGVMAVKVAEARVHPRACQVAGSMSEDLDILNKP